MESIVAFEGVVTDFVWRNPHVYVLVERTDGSREGGQARGNDAEGGQAGEGNREGGRAYEGDQAPEAGQASEGGREAAAQARQWELQMGPVNTMSRRGWRRDTLQSGDRVSVRAHVALSGRPYGIVESIDKDGGLALAAAAVGAPAPATATTLEGRWIADRSATMSYPGGFDGFFNALLKVNEKGRAARDAYDPLSDENPEASCIGRPTPAALVSTSLYLLEIDIREEEQTVVLHSEWFDEVRTVHLDGRGHPPPDERFVTGHSIGWWEGDTLVVDTRNFADHRSPYQIGVPSGAQKHVVERYRLTEDGTHIDLEFVLDDPEFLAEPMVHRRQLNHAPHLRMYPGECDPEATSRFLGN